MEKERKTIDCEFREEIESRDIFICLKSEHCKYRSYDAFFFYGRDCHICYSKDKIVRLMESGNSNVH